MRTHRASRVLLPGLALAAGALWALAPQLSGCGGGKSRAYARVVTARDQLVGGPRALGDIGDFVLHNGRIRAVVQGKSASRGFGVFGGSLIDLDLERPRADAEGKAVGGDGLSEVFPAFFLRGLEPDDVYVKSDGSDGGEAIVAVRGRGAEFITMVGGANQMLHLKDGFVFETEYVLEPVSADDPPEKGRSILIRVTARNDTADPLYLPVSSLPVAFGLVTLLGDGQSLFVPGDAGFDLRFSLERAYKKAPPLPAVPGLVTRVMASAGDRVSYAFAPEPSNSNFVYQLRDKFGLPKSWPSDSMVVPFVASSFTGLFVHRPPDELKPKGDKNGRDATTYSTRIFVGTGDIASALDLVTAAKGDPHGQFTGKVREDQTLEPVGGANVTLLSVIDKDKPYQPVSESACLGALGQSRDPRELFAATSARSLPNGRVQAKVPPGCYFVAATHPDRHVRYEGPFFIPEGGGAYREIRIGRRAFLSASVVDSSGRPMPAKISVLGRYAPDDAGKLTREFLFDLRIGESWLYSDMIPDDAKRPETLEYLERPLFAGATGNISAAVRPGRYRLVASRGPEYGTAEHWIELAPGDSKHVAFRLDQVVPTPGYISSDLHVHSVLSIDSGISLADRALTYAAEGVDYLALTDHNYVGNLNPDIERLGLADWVQSTPGVELTTLELGHFNAFPLKYDRGAITHGSFEWFRIPAGNLFERLRGLGMFSPEQTIVQINHPRDTIMGYFNAFDLDANAQPIQRNELLMPVGPEFELGAWSEAFDTVEILNGKRIDLVHTQKAPPDANPATLPYGNQPGEILRDENGKIAFPGNFEDWFALLRRGKVVTATANSDSHEAINAEAGTPRTLIRVERDPRSAREIDHAAIVSALRRQAAIMTNGPFAQLRINDVEVGGLAQAPAGRAAISVTVAAPAWCPFQHVRLLFADGTSKELAPADFNGTRFELAFEQVFERDTFLVLEVEGRDNLWPVVTPRELPSLLITEAVGSIGESLGFPLEDWGELEPDRPRPVTPYALTNPIWVDVDGDGVSYGKGRKAAALTRASAPAKPRASRGVDLMRLFGQWAHH